MFGYDTPPTSAANPKRIARAIANRSICLLASFMGITRAAPNDSEVSEQLEHGATHAGEGG